jgi:hypothetical protein
MTTIQVLGAAAIAVVLAIPSWNGWTADSKISTHASLVNRDHKGDRLPLVPTFHFDADKRSQQNTPPAAVARELPDGCESAVSPIVDKHLARIADRCIS